MWTFQGHFRDKKWTFYGHFSGVESRNGADWRGLLIAFIHMGNVGFALGKCAMGG
jgi:hypothetical protein